MRTLPMGTIIQELAYKDKNIYFYFSTLMFCAGFGRLTHVVVQGELLILHVGGGGLVFHKILEAAGPLQGELQNIEKGIKKKHKLQQ